jgi:hypothetical protein
MAARIRMIRRTVAFENALLFMVLLLFAEPRAGAPGVIRYYEVSPTKMMGSRYLPDRVMNQLAAHPVRGQILGIKKIS